MTVLRTEIASCWTRAPLAAQRPELQPLIEHLRETAQGRDDIRVECAGLIAGCGTGPHCASRHVDIWQSPPGFGDAGAGADASDTCRDLPHYPLPACRCSSRRYRYASMRDLTKPSNATAAAINIGRASDWSALYEAYPNITGYSQLTVVPCLVNGFTPRVGRRW